MDSASCAPETTATPAAVSKPEDARGDGIQSTEPSSSSTTTTMDAVVEPETPVLLREAQEQLEALYAIHDFFFSAKKGEKQTMLRAACDKVLATLAAFGEGHTARERARVCLLRGRALDAMEAFDPAAEAALTRAVKLEPSDVCAWNALGHVFWKKGDSVAARDCLLQGLARRPNKESLRMLSMVLRQLPPTAAAPASSATAAAGTGTGSSGSGSSPVLAGQGQGQMPKTATAVEESVQRAKEAVALDVRDSQSWYVLGNAFVALFFSTSHNPLDLDRALGAYQKAEANGGGSNPDLYFNLAQVRSYREEFSQAAAALHKAADLDPGLPVAGHLRAMERRVARTVELLAKRGKVKEKRLQLLAASLRQEEEEEEQEAAARRKGKKGGGQAALLSSSSSLALSQVRVKLADVREGPNPGAVLALKLVLPLGQLAEPPSSFIVIDAAGECGVISVYHLGLEAARRLDSATATAPTGTGTGTTTATLLVVNPHVKRVHGPDGGGEGAAAASSSYRAVQILDPLSLLVGGRPLPPLDLAPARLCMEAFDG